MELSNKGIISREQILLQSLLTFFSIPKHINILVLIVNSKTNISLRLLDWFPTNYARFNKILIDDIDVYLDYKKQLKGYSKTFCDPFNRRKRLFLEFDINSIETSKEISFKYQFIGKSPSVIKEFSQRTDGIVTTVGQLNFFRWCIKTKIIDYVFEHVKEIEKNMLDTIAKRNDKKNKKEENLSKVSVEKENKKILISRNNGMSKTLVKVTIKFD